MTFDANIYTKEIEGERYVPILEYNAKIVRAQAEIKDLQSQRDQAVMRLEEFFHAVRISTDIDTRYQFEQIFQQAMGKLEKLQVERDAAISALHELATTRQSEPAYRSPPGSPAGLRGVPSKIYAAMVLYRLGLIEVEPT